MWGLQNYYFCCFVATSFLIFVRWLCSEAFLFLLSARACGLGIDLPGITSVLILDSDWDPKADVQALGRAHTLGSLGTSARPLRMLRLFMRNSVEERILMLAERRGGVGAAFRPGSAGGCASPLAQECALILASPNIVPPYVCFATTHTCLPDLACPGAGLRGHGKHEPPAQREWQYLPAHAL